MGSDPRDLRLASAGEGGAMLIFISCLFGALAGHALARKDATTSMRWIIGILILLWFMRCFVPEAPK